MIDIDEMERWCIGAILEHCSEINAFSSDEVIELITRLREAEKDAERYRWIRNCTTVESKKLVSDSGGWIVGLGVLDGMIDQAMKEKGDE